MSDSSHTDEATMIRHSGGCHCGDVSFEVEAPADLELHDCNCSICSMTGFLHIIVPKNRFHVLRGEGHLQEYRFNTGVARHLFCKRCGVKSFYVPRSNPDGVSVNFRCLDRSTVRSWVVRAFDGQNWEASAGELTHLA
ncbi:MAG: GFA family protein [Gammaproteobacteria bacterium]|nr:MAG: GFA family protein [Gammaproteobacteria bacterium]